MTEDTLVPLRSTERLLVEPIWEVPIDEIEGPLYQEYMSLNPAYNKVYVRQTVKEMLDTAALSLPTNLQLIVRAGHRPLEVQKRLLEMVKQDYLSTNPEATQQQALEFARTFVSDPEVKLPPHCCGAAVDVDVLDVETEQLVDFGCPVNTDDEISFLDTDKINDAQRANRQILQDAMLGAGFAPFIHEWWHFSYGDQIWADYYKKTTELYSIIEV